jgi:hypothetical protein
MELGVVLHVDVDLSGVETLQERRNEGFVRGHVLVVDALLRKSLLGRLQKLRESLCGHHLVFADRTTRASATLRLLTHDHERRADRARASTELPSQSSRQLGARSRAMLAAMSVQRLHIVRDAQRGLYFVRREQQGHEFKDHWTSDRANAERLSAEDAERLVDELLLTARQRCSVEVA